MTDERTEMESQDENLNNANSNMDGEGANQDSVPPEPQSLSGKASDSTLKNEILETVNKLIGNAQTREALKFLSSNGYDVFGLMGSFEELERDKQKQLVSVDDYKKHKNKINDAILEIARNGNANGIKNESLPDFEILHEEFTKNTIHYKPLSIDEIGKQRVVQVLRKRVLFVRCQDSSILSSAYHAITDHYFAQTHSVKFFQPSVDISQLGEGRRVEIDYYEKTIQKREATTVVVLDNPPIYFLNGFEKTHQRAIKITQHLEEKNVALICLLPSSKYEKEEFNKLYRSIKKEAKDIFEYWDISYLQPFLETHFEKGAVEELLPQIKSLKINEDELYLDIQSISIEDYSDPQSYFDALKQKVQDRVSTEKKALESLRQQFENGNFLQRVILFIGAFFPGIAVKEFNFLVEFYLQKAPPVPITQSKEGEPIVNEPSWIERWREKSAELLRSSLMKPLLKDEGRVIEFVQQSYGVQFKEFLLEEYYTFIEPWLNQAGNAGFLFGNFSERMQRSTIQLIVTATCSDPTSYDEFWLKNIVANIKANFDGVDGSNLSSDNLITQLLELYQQFAIKQHYKQLFYARLTDLIKELLSERDTPLLQNIVEKFIKILIDSSDAKSDALDIVLRLYRHLKGTPNFNEDFVLNNIKRIINESNAEQQWRTYNALLQILDMDELFERMEVWRNGEKQTGFSHLEEYAYRFYYDYSMAQLSEIDEVAYGQTPPVLFHELSDDNKLDASSRIAILLDRLFDKRTEQAMRRFLLRQMNFLPPTIHAPSSLVITIGSEDTKRDWAKLLGNLIEGWTWVVYGIQQKKVASDNDARLVALFKQIFKRASKEQVKGIFEWWQQKPTGVYSLKIQEITTSNLKPKEKEQEKNLYLLRREHLRRMRERAIKINNSNHSS